MKYKINLNDEDYLRFNIFYANHSKAGKHTLNMARIAFPVLAIAIISVFTISGVSHGLILTEGIVLAAASVTWWISMPRIAEKNIRKNMIKAKADGKLPFHADSEIEFQDSMIVERSSQGEFHVNYQDIENIYPEKDYLYIFYSAMQAFIIPNHCLGKDREQVIGYLMEKEADKNFSDKNSDKNFLRKN